MKNERRNLSRRKVLGAIGTVGGAAALGGAGTLAFFSDDEQFSNNRLVAGTLDLKLDWEEYYADWSTDEAAAVDGGPVLMADQPDQYVSEYPEDYTGLPTPENALVAIPTEDVADFLDAAATEAYPDTTDDGRVDYPEGYDVCIHGADAPEDLDPTADPATLEEATGDFATEGTGLRTNSDDTVVDGLPKPLISIEDLKPGDFGEVTFSTHLCDNDGYLWLNVSERSAGDNSLTEPERKDSDEDDGLASGELADQIRVAVWFDGVETNDRGIDPNPEPSDPSGNNLIDPGEVIIQEMSLSAFLTVAGTDRGIGLVPPVIEGGDLVQTGGQMTFTCAEDVGTITQPGSSGVQPGQSFTVGSADGVTTLTIGDVRTDDSGSTVDFDFEVTGPESYAPGNFIGVCAVEIVGSERTLAFDYGPGGCVRESLFLPRFDQPSVGTVEEVAFDFCVLNGAGGGQQLDQQCFVGSNTYYIGFAWWLPVDHANEVQTDSVSFDLGFYAEQCRHNPNPFGGVT